MCCGFYSNVYIDSFSHVQTRSAYLVMPVKHGAGNNIVCYFPNPKHNFWGNIIYACFMYILINSITERV